MIQQQDKMLALAERTTECPNAARHGVEHCRADIGSGLYEHGDCHGTGRVYLLDPDGRFGLRGKCAFDTGYKHPGGMWFVSEYFTQREHNETVALVAGTLQPSSRRTIPSCPCRGRGWTPSQDIVVWLKVTWALHLHVDSWYDDGIELEYDDEYVLEHRPSRTYFGGEGADPLEALLNALNEAMMAEERKP